MEKSAETLLGVTFSRREPCEGRLALNPEAIVPRLLWLQRSRTPAEPEKPSWLQLTETVAVAEPRLKSATVKLPSAFGFVVRQTCCELACEIGVATLPAWSTAMTSVLVIMARSVLSRFLRSAPVKNWAQLAAHTVAAVRRSVTVNPS